MEKTLSSQATNWKEGRRLRAWELYQEGWKQRDVGNALGVTQGAVSQWLKHGREEDCRFEDELCEVFRAFEPRVRAELRSRSFG